MPQPQAETQSKLEALICAVQAHDAEVERFLAQPRPSLLKKLGASFKRK
jgi:hypothetical protein